MVYVIFFHISEDPAFSTLDIGHFDFLGRMSGVLFAIVNLILIEDFNRKFSIKFKFPVTTNM